MVDLSDKESQSEEMSSQSDNNNNHINLKTCVDCGTSKTPLWRGGPAGPKSLCNACGIRSRKKRRALMGGVTKEEKKIKKSGKNSNNSVISNQSSSSNSCTSSSGDSTSKKVVHFSINKKMFDFGGRDVRFQRPRSHRRKLGEEEQAAFLLMALSCGSVYA